MAFEHGCFVSHVHAREPLMQEFIDGLVKALSSELEPLLGDRGTTVYIDEDELRPGFRFNRALARGLCGSACWVMVYVPQYFRREYCLREFRAMQVLEEERRRQLGKKLPSDRSMIIPIILRGRREQLPDAIKKEWHYLEFSRFSTATGEILRNESYMGQIMDLADYIHEMFQLGEALADDCDQFAIPELDGDPGFEPPAQGFPGRPSAGTPGADG